MGARRVFIIALVVAGVAGPGDAGARVVRIERAEVAVAEDATAPGADARWREVALPHRWAGPGDAAPSDRWYRIRLAPDESEGRPLGVLLHDLAMNAEVRWNGELLGDGGRFEPPIAQNFHRPLYFPVPAALVRSGGNELLVRVAAAPHFYGWLGPIDVGPDATLGEVFEREMFWRQGLPQATGVLGVIVVMLSTAFWFASRESLYAWFGAAVLLSTFAGLNLHLREIPLSTVLWARAVQWAVATSPLPFAIYAHRFARVDRPRLERAFALVGLGLTLAAVLVPPPFFLPSFTVLHLLGGAIGVYALIVVGVSLWRGTVLDGAIFAAAAVLLLAIGIHDVAVQFGQREGAPRYGWAPATPVFFLAFGSLVTLRFVRTLRRSERANEELEERVREKHAELETHFERLRGLEQERVLGAERERMMREMHDGLGSRLVETLSMVESGEADPEEVATALRGSLDEMRLMLDSLDPLAGDLSALLATIRERLEPSLRRQGVTLEWQVESLARASGLGPGECLHVLRIVQEAFTNVIKHASASRVALRARYGDGCIEIEVADDGRGFASEAGRGRGLDNMRERAASLGGSLEIRRESGVAVALRIPG